MVGGWDRAQLLLAGDVTGCYRPFPPGVLSGSVFFFFPREVLNNLHPPRCSFWAVFVKVNLQQAASGDPDMRATFSLNNTGVIALVLPPQRWHNPQQHHGAGRLLGTLCPSQ